MLASIGYRVTALQDPLAALTAFREQPDGFDLVITDQAMPHMSGCELARELLSVRPSLPIILCTGFSDSVDDDRARAAGIRGFILKPIRLQELSGMIRALLQEDRRA